MDDLIQKLNSMDVVNSEQRAAVNTVIDLLKLNEVDPRQISISDYMYTQISMFD